MADKSTFTAKLSVNAFTFDAPVIIVGAMLSAAEGHDVQFGTDPAGNAPLLDWDNKSALAGIAAYVPLSIPIQAGDSLYLQSSAAFSGATILFVLK